MQIKSILVMLAMLTAQAGHASVKLSGDVPSIDFPGLQGKIDRIWEYERQTFLGSKEVAEPEISFYVFIRARESKEWIEFQSQWLAAHADILKGWIAQATSQNSAEWVAAHVDKNFPFPADFRGLFYADTNQLQISPSYSFYRYYQNGPDGMKRDQVGYGYYSTAHEMLHYVFAAKGIPLPLHHCLFITATDGGQSPMEVMTDFLIREKLSPMAVRMFGYQEEMGANACADLTPEQREQLKTWQKN
jgi:hypothetical protein